jgi:hypothetical protein
MNCINENTENKTPIIPPAATSDTSSALRYGSACLGITGKTMPKPKRSIKTVKKTMSKANLGVVPWDTGCDVIVNSLKVSRVERHCRRLV